MQTEDTEKLTENEAEEFKKDVLDRTHGILVNYCSRTTLLKATCATLLAYRYMSEQFVQDKDTPEAVRRNRDNSIKVLESVLNMPPEVQLAFVEAISEGVDFELADRQK